MTAEQQKYLGELLSFFEKYGFITPVPENDLYSNYGVPSFLIQRQNNYARLIIDYSYTNQLFQDIPQTMPEMETSLEFLDGFGLASVW